MSGGRGAHGDTPSAGWLAWPERRPGWFALLFFAACVILWTVVLLGYFEGKIDFEEQMYGNLPKDLLEGRIANVTGYHTQAWEGGTYPFGFFIVPFFALLGPSLFALKVAGIAFAAAAMVAWVDLARRLGGGGAAWAMALLLLLPVPFVLRMILTAFSPPTHMGTVIFSGLTLWFVHRGFGERTMGERTAALLGGLTLGIGCAWAFSLWPIALGIGVAALLLRVPFRRLLLAAAAMVPGVAVMFAFLLYPIMDAQRGGFWVSLLSGSWMRMISNQPRVEMSPLAQLWRLLTVHFPRMAGYVPEGASPAQMALHPSWIHYALFLAALAFLGARGLSARRARRVAGMRHWLILSVPALAYMGAYLASHLYGPEHGGYDRYRYFMPMVPFGALAMAMAVAQLGRLGRPRFARVAPRAALGLLLGTGLLAAANVFSPAAVPTLYRHVRGYDVSVMYAEQADPVHEAGLALAGRHDYAELARAMGAKMGARIVREQPDMDAEADRLPEALQVDFWEGLGAGFRRALDRLLGTRVFIKAPFVMPRPDRQAIPERHLATLRVLLTRGGPQRRFAVAMGFSAGLAHFGPLSRLDTEAILDAALAGPELSGALKLAKEAFYEAQGMVQANLLLLDPFADLVPFPEDQGPQVTRGLAIGFARKLLPETPWPAGAPVPLSLPRLGARFVRWVHEEQRRYLTMMDAYAEQSPFEAAAEERRRSGR